ncbi:uncharacterized protein K460DRAFT_167976 [Cucurbitaria berberidis CBS 394.84]|uniref:Uncharacterized protein n=1 Tax=Cucurbitaria berberidis CBS 394.84 TaxID=1168544 RepID=A0A9P4G981_9PLEO|nr:uncharacterized protein K460DRAFT_167976 [Cucurbitaria berberidis CBS 394.84]KAF1841468.1 hypothetical protein K460DRAFT_167976 [Cucurbitaria berberidis CBS 394.84]
MAAPSPTSNQLPTVWLAPPEGLLPSSHKIKVEPAPIAISSALALLVLLIVSLIFNNKKKKGSHMEDMVEATQGVDKERPVIGPGNSQQAGHISLEPTQARPKLMSRSSSMYSNRSRRKGMKNYSSESLETTWEDFEYDTPAQVPKDIPRIRLPSPVYKRNGNLDADTTPTHSFTVDFDDKSALDSEASYGRYGHADTTSVLDLPGYPASYNPSAFQPLAPEEVGMHGKIWK